MQARRTCNCVSRLLRLNHYDLVLKHFWEKLMTDNIGFSLCGIFQIDRSLLTSVSGEKFITKREKHRKKSTANLHNSKLER